MPGRPSRRLRPPGVRLRLVRTGRSRPQPSARVSGELGLCGASAGSAWGCDRNRRHTWPLRIWGGRRRSRRLLRSRRCRTHHPRPGQQRCQSAPQGAPHPRLLFIFLFLFVARTCHVPRRCRRHSFLCVLYWRLTSALVIWQPNRGCPPFTLFPRPDTLGIRGRLRPCRGNPRMMQGQPLPAGDFARATAPPPIRPARKRRGQEFTSTLIYIVDRNQSM